MNASPVERVLGLIRRLMAPQQRTVVREHAAMQSQDRALRRLEELAEDWPDAVFAKDRAGRYLLYNPAVERITGKTAAQVLGRDDTAIFAPEQAMMFRAHDERVMAQDRPESMEEEVENPDGRRITFLSTKAPLRDAQGRVVGMFGIARDITERKHAETALRISEAYRRSLFEQLADAVLVVDRRRRIVDANPQAVTMLGYARDELLRLSVPDLLPELEHKRLDTEVRELLAGQQRLTDWEHVRKDGSRFPAEVSLRALEDGTYLAVIRDNTIRRESEKALMAYQLELSELAHRLLTQEKITTQRLAQALHDHLGQTLAVARLNLDACITMHDATMPAPLKQQTTQIAGLLAQAVREVRQVLTDLRPPLLEEQGLVAALDNEIRSRAVAVGNADMLLEAADDVTRQRWPGDVEYGAFMVAREAIANARQHAGATLIRVVLSGDSGTLKLEIIDDGIGTPAALVRGRPGHLGIVGMRERSIAIGARFSIEDAPGGGTRLTMRWEAHKS